MINLLANFINKIKLAHKNRAQTITVRSSNLIIRILVILQHKGIISCFSILKDPLTLDNNTKYVKI